MPDAARQFSAHMSTLPTLLAHARLHLQGRHLSPSVVKRIELVLEELFTNSVVHGYAGRADGLVWLDIQHRQEAVKLVYTDAAPLYDPLEHKADLEYRNEQRAAGGLGVLLARKLADEIDYRFIDDKNVLTLSFRVDA